MLQKAPGFLQKVMPMVQQIAGLFGGGGGGGGAAAPAK
jgi:hypothetical protein